MAKKQKIDFSKLWYLVYNSQKRSYTAMSYYDYSKISFPFNLKVVQKGNQEEIQRIAIEQNQKSKK